MKAEAKYEGIKAVYARRWVYGVEFVLRAARIGWNA